MNRAASHIVLVGFMGAGKTTIGRLLAARLERTFIDLDDLINEQTGRTPRQIIDRDGEATFREVEGYALRSVLEETQRALVIATGGGAWTIEVNRQIILAHGCLTVWLDAPFELCWQRIASLVDTRPLARDEVQARELYEQRRASYRLAGHRIEIASTLTASDIAVTIANRLVESELIIKGDL